MSDRKQLDERVLERWGSQQLANDIKRMSYNGALLALKYGPNWYAKASEDEKEQAKFAVSGSLFL